MESPKKIKKIYWISRDRERMEVSWGILGCASIARKNVRALQLAKNCRIKAVASRNMEKASKFCTDLHLDLKRVKICCYEDLISDTSVTAVYIPLPTSLHVDWVIKAANSKKHVLIEKPVALMASDLLQMIEACENNGVLLMDGTMFMHHQRTKELVDHLADPLYIGSTQHLKSAFCFNGGANFLETNIRCKADQDRLGCLGDLGHYCIRFSLLATALNTAPVLESTSTPGCYSSLTFQSPISVNATCHKWLGDELGSVPLHCEARVVFASGSTLSFECSFLHPFQQDMNVALKSGNEEIGDSIIKMDDFVIPNNPQSASFHITSYPVSGSLIDLHTRVVTSKSSDEVTRCCQEACMFENFSNLVLQIDACDGKEEWSLQIRNQVVFWRDIILRTQHIQDLCYLSMKNGTQINLEQ